MLNSSQELVFSLEENALSPLLDAVLDRLQSKPILLLNGDLGAGKTSFVKQLCLQLGINEKVASPSFSLVNTYLLPNGNPLYHIDLYRIDHIDEFWNIGGSDLIAGEDYCIIEWPEKILPFLEPADCVFLNIKNTSSFNGRIYTLI
jgi:tRNA threonylcarbamoyladenosine biosynthesis protein TsaE